MLLLEIYRNPKLAEAMVSLNMSDTQGGGIKRMFQAQWRRLAAILIPCTLGYHFAHPLRQVAIGLSGHDLRQ